MAKKSFAIVLLMGLATSQALAVQPEEITAREFQLYMDWKEGCEDERLAEVSEDVRYKKIAKNLGVSAKELKATVAKVEPLAKDIPEATKRAIAAAMKATPINGRHLETLIDAEQGHVVGGVKWRCGDARDIDKEAAYVAWAVAEGGQVIETLALWCVNEIDTKLFSAKIGRNGFARINKSGIERFASSRYIKLFEGIKRGPHK